ncbi:MAG: hypothetical protein EOP83_16210, partial [Verrucomicrobiaceae bacterium]
MIRYVQEFNTDRFDSDELTNVLYHRKPSRNRWLNLMGSICFAVGGKHHHMPARESRTRLDDGSVFEYLPVYDLGLHEEYLAQGYVLFSVFGTLHRETDQVMIGMGKNSEQDYIIRIHSTNPT